MNLNSLSFIAFFSVFLVIMSVLQWLRNKNQRVFSGAQLVLLLGFSYYCIQTFNLIFLACVFFVTVITFLVGIKLDGNKSRVWLGGGIIVLIGFLAYFKYTNFMVNSFRALAGLDSVTLKIILPIGVSFYIFSAVAYLIDVYRGEYKAERNFLLFAVYIAFFPKLVAGPIVRGKDFLPQIRAYRGIKFDSVKIGVQIFAFGLFKKMVLADHLGVFVDDVFHAPAAFNTGTVILAVFSYSLQIYFDFSGYSDMAIGLSKILGFDCKPNFNLPYLAQNVSEFWKRWHISLSSWFQDYLYIPLGGSRKGTFRTYFNLIFVMLVSGLWHGAGWTFVAWGALYGIASCIHKAIGNKTRKLGKIVNTGITFIIVTLFWVVFRAESFSNALDVWRAMFTVHSGINQPYIWSFFAFVCLAFSSIAAWRKSKKSKSVDRSGQLAVNGFYPVMELSKFWPLVLFFTFCGLIIIMGYFGNTAFIYGNF